MRRKTLLTTVIIAVALVGCNKAGAEVPPTTEEELASTSIEETSYTKTVEEITSTEEVATTTTIAPTEPTIMIETTSTKEVVTTIKEKVTSTKEVASTEIETTTVAPTETSGEGIIEAETTSVANTKEPEEPTTVTSATTVAPTTTVARTETETTVAPATTVAPTTTEAPTTTVAPATTEVPTTEPETTTVAPTEPETTTHVHQYEDGKCGWWPCTICGEYALVTKPLPTEHCPYTLNTKIYNDDGTISFYYVDSNATDEKYGYNDGGAGNRAHNDFSNWCELNYYDVIGDYDVGDYAEGVVCELIAKPY